MRIVAAAVTVAVAAAAGDAAVIAIAAIAHWNVAVHGLMLLRHKAHHVTAVHHGVYRACVCHHLPAAVR